MANARQSCRPERLTIGTGYLILSHLNAEIGPSIRLGVAVHRVIEQVARIGFLITDDQPISLQHGNGARGLANRNLRDQNWQVQDAASKSA